MGLREPAAKYLVRAGSKNTDIGYIPEDWDAKKLGELGDALIGLTYKPSDVRSDGILVLRSSNIQDGSLRFDDNVFVDMEVPEKIMARDGDILICVRNGSRELIGKCVRLDEQARGMTFGAFMAVFRAPDSSFLYQQFRFDVVKRQISQHLGATINQITNKSLNAFLVPFPREPVEREAIADALSDADALIEALEQLIAKKRHLKHGAMQELLTAKKRLPGFRDRWQVRRLDEVGRFLKGSGVKKDESLSGSIPCIRYGEIYTNHNDYVREFHSWISREVAASATRLVQGDILFAGSGETRDEIGKCVAFVDEFEAYAGGDIVILRPANDTDSLFLGYYLNTPPVCRQKASKGQGDAVVHITGSALADIQIFLPSVKEQMAIAAILVDLDAEIFELVAKLRKARQIKQGMMRELLTGRTRLV